MIYIVVLNWNAAQDTINCIQSLLKLGNFNEVKLIVCDNDSNIECYTKISKFLETAYGLGFREINESDLYHCFEESYNAVLIRNKENYGYAGGNNCGIQYALNQKDMQYVWILNNDTEVDVDSLTELVKKIETDTDYGIVGSKLIDYERREKIQGVGGVINPHFCTTKEIGSELNINDTVDETSYEKQIDYVIGASMLLSRRCLEKVGLLCEDYFLYYEEIDICNRIREQEFKVGIASKSLVFHKQGASTSKGKSDVADYFSVRNRILIGKKFYKNSIFFVKIAILGAILNRFRRGEFKRGLDYVKFFKI
jgi:GT2 family glycosyltransferase